MCGNNQPTQTRHRHACINARTGARWRARAGRRRRPRWAPPPGGRPRPERTSQPSCCWYMGVVCVRGGAWRERVSTSSTTCVRCRAVGEPSVRGGGAPQDSDRPEATGGSIDSRSAPASILDSGVEFRTNRRGPRRRRHDEDEQRGRRPSGGVCRWGWRMSGCRPSEHRPKPSRLAGANTTTKAPRKQEGAASSIVVGTTPDLRTPVLANTGESTSSFSGRA